MTDVNENISKNLEYYMRLHSLNNKELSEILGVSESTVGKWLLKKATPRMGMVEKIAEYFQVKKSDILEDNNLDQQQEFTSASEAMKWLLEQNVIMAYGGVDLERLSDEEKIDYANEVLNQLRLVGYKYKKE